MYSEYVQPVLNNCSYLIGALLDAVLTVTFPKTSNNKYISLRSASSGCSQCRGPVLDSATVKLLQF